MSVRQVQRVEFSEHVRVEGPSKSGVTTVNAGEGLKMTFDTDEQLLSVVVAGDPVPTLIPACKIKLMKPPAPKAAEPKKVA